MTEEISGSPPLTRVSGLVYGVRVRGDLPAGFQPFLRPHREPEAAREPALDVSYRSIRALPDVDRIWSAEPSPATPVRLALFRQTSGFGLTVEGDGEGLFRITPQAIAIEWLPGGGGATHPFFSYALPLWLELTGVPVLHASAVSFGRRAVAFVGSSGVGKSTLCAGLVRVGCSFVADDGLPLRESEDGRWQCACGPPWLKLWPSALEERLGLSVEPLPRVQRSLAKRMLSCAAPAPRQEVLSLAAVYVLLGRVESLASATVSECSAREALIHLIENSLAPAPAAALGWSARRLGQLARVAERTPVGLLRLPVRSDDWRSIRQAIAADIGAAGPSPQRSR